MDNEHKAKKIVAAIKADFTDRRGLRQEWEQIDDDIQREIEAKWLSIVLKILNKVDKTAPPMPVPAFVEPVVHVSQKARDLELITNFIHEQQSTTPNTELALSKIIDPKLAKYIARCLADQGRESPARYYKLLVKEPGDTYTRTWVKGMLDEYS